MRRGSIYPDPNSPSYSDVHLTRKSEYALRGLAYFIPLQRGTRVPLAEVAAAQQLPTTFLAKIFQDLARHGVLEADRGPGRGYRLHRAPSEVRLREVVEATEGPMALKRCLLWGNDCGESEPCPLHHRLVEFRSRLDGVLDGVTLADYAKGSAHGQSRQWGATS